MTIDGSKGLTRPSPSLSWQDDLTPMADAYGDVYYSRDSGVDESRYVFLEQNRLSERWSALTDDPATQFCVAETGFGTGLNFLLSWQCWRQHAPQQARLLFISIEAHPLAACDQRRALACWQELTPFAEQLLAARPPPLSGMHLLQFDGGRVSLLLVLDEVMTALDALLPGTHVDCLDCPLPRVDAWFLDGFAPSRNPAMWREEVLVGVAALSRSGTTLSTFTATGQVRRGLTAAGFQVEKTSGYGSKREMLRARFTTHGEAVIGSIRGRQTPWHWQTPLYPQARQVVVVGAGIAGCCTARALARRGWQVRVLDRCSRPGSGASGNPQGILYTRLPLQRANHGDFTLASFLYAMRFYRQLRGSDPSLAAAIHLDGVLQLAVSAAENGRRQRRQQLYGDLDGLLEFVDAERASTLSGMAIETPGTWFADAGWLQPGPLCTGLLTHPNIQVLGEYDLEMLSCEDGRWRLQCRDRESLESQLVVLANAGGADELIELAYLGLRQIRGQVTTLPDTSSVSELQCVVCADSYVAPPLDGQYCIGASYHLDDADMTPRMADHQYNLDSLDTLLPGFRQRQVEPQLLAGRVGQRCSSRDYLPIVGAVPDQGAFMRIFSPLAKDARQFIDASGPMQAGLYLNIAHGSRGLCSAPLCGELLAAQLSGEISIVPRELLRALHPARFLLRRLIRGQAG